MIRVFPEFCMGCNLCVAQCPHDAIRVAFGKAWIDQRRCTLCNRCIEACPQGAIREEVRVSVEEIRAVVNSVHDRAKSTMSRIDGLMRKDGAS